MTERLIIRLASEASQKQHWLIWSESEEEIIASGDIDNAKQLKTLAEKASSRQVTCLLPGVDVCIKEVPITGAFNRQMQQALPYLIEEDLAGDVEQLHFTVLTKSTDLVHVAVCDKQRMRNWLGWLSDAQISCAQFIPEGLALPSPAGNKWQAAQIDNHWIIRENKDLAWSCELSMLDALLTSKIDLDNQPTIESYTSLTEKHHGNWVNNSPTLPMEVLALGVVKNRVNLLTGEFKAKKESNKDLIKWRLPAIFTALFFVISCINLVMENRKLEIEVAQVKEQVESVYQLAFPTQSKLKYSRIKKKLKTLLAEMGEGSQPASFLVMLDNLAPAFKANEGLVPSSLKYDGAKQEMRILAVGDNFQAFEKFSSTLPAGFTVEQGALKSSKDQVSGLLTIRKQ